MKITEAQNIKPGMVIAIKRRKDYNDICLVTARRGHRDIEYTHLDLEDSYNGLMIGSIDGKEKVKIITGAKRKAIIERIKDDVFRKLHDTESLIDMLRLIESMGDSKSWLK